MSWRSASLSPSAAAATFSCKRCSFVVPGIGTIQGFWASSQASAIWAGVAFFLLSHFAEQVDQRPIRLPSLRRETRYSVAEIGAIKGGIFVDFARKVALAQRTERPKVTIDRVLRLVGGGRINTTSESGALRRPRWRFVAGGIDPRSPID